MIKILKAGTFKTIHKDNQNKGSINKINNQNRTQIEQSRNIQKSLGTKRAAGYLRNCGFSVEACVYILLGA